MDVIEKAIRNAFEKGDASDQAFRERVYRQAFAALDRVLQANPGVTVESAIKRRKSLQAKIVDIEQEFTNPREPQPDPLLVTVPPLPTEAASESPRVVHPPVEAPVLSPRATPVPEVSIVSVGPAPRTAAPPVPAPQAPEPPAPEPRVEPEPVVEAPAPAYEPFVPEVTVEDAAPEPQAEQFEPVIPVSERRVEPEVVSDDVRPTERVVAGRERRRRPMAAMFVAVTLFSILAIGVWWAMQTGLLGNTTQSEPVRTVLPPTDDFEPGADEPPVEPGQADASRDWIEVFNGNDANSLSAPSDASAEAMHDEGQNFVRIKSGESGAAVLIDVNPGVLEQIAGKRATFDIVAKAQEGQDTQMSVTCNFGELGDCGRKRYAVGNARADYLFEIDMPAKKPGAAGTIAINSDFENKGKSVDIYEVKVSVQP
ncbi:MULTISPECIES: hypothetical protein [Mesorhizobium]|uniref:Uncharacterized protein n=1 Tax=Mesorhizobium denitrificans TaxID=2294114 RepID=A0A371XJ51_9HYPH|nr:MULTISPECIES: hypothetical protein [Mesorhizobium]RFC69241.1 hypothetical protein DY251_00340 [Mesorhizobium denitrificans]